MKNHSEFLKAVQLDPSNYEIRQEYADFLKRVRDKRAPLLKNKLVYWKRELEQRNWILTLLG